MSLDDMFKHPERASLSDTQFEMLMKQREREKNQRNGLVVFLVIIGVVAGLMAVGILAVNGVFGG